ncbi:MAG: HAD-IA family hydrolase [Pseudomonadota bacterium]
MKALLIGSIGVVAETSDIQRRAYNQALAEAGVEWQWDHVTYRKLLHAAGGRERLQWLSASEGGRLSQVQIESIHARKTELACAEMRQGVTLRPGIAELIGESLARHVPVAFVTSTYRPNIDAIIDGARGALPIEQFAAIITRDDVLNAKPAPDVYLTALARLGITASDAVAIEDSETSVDAARAAGIYTIATPGVFTQDQYFGAANVVLESVEGLGTRLFAGAAA